MKQFQFSARAIKKIFDDHSFKVLSGLVDRDFLIEGPLQPDTITYPFLSLITKSYTKSLDGNKNYHNKFIVFNSIYENHTDKFLKIKINQDQCIVVHIETFKEYPDDIIFLIDFDGAFQLRPI